LLLLEYIIKRFRIAGIRGFAIYETDQIRINQTSEIKKNG